MHSGFISQTGEEEGLKRKGGGESYLGYESERSNYRDPSTAGGSGHNLDKMGFS